MAGGAEEVGLVDLAGVDAAALEAGDGDAQVARDGHDGDGGPGEIEVDDADDVGQAVEVISAVADVVNADGEDVHGLGAVAEGLAGRGEGWAGLGGVECGLGGIQRRRECGGGLVEQGGGVIGEGGSLQLDGEGFAPEEGEGDEASQHEQEEDDFPKPGKRGFVYHRVKISLTWNGVDGRCAWCWAMVLRDSAAR